MAGIYSQGGSAGHRYAGWLSEVEAKNFQFGGKVFNGSPSAIYVGSNLVWSYWLKHATWEAIVGAFGQRDGTAVINAMNQYLNGLSQSDPTKATMMSDEINNNPIGWGNIFINYTIVDYIRSDGNQYIDLGFTQNFNTTTSDICVVIEGQIEDFSNNPYIFGSAAGGNYTQYGYLAWTGSRWDFKSAGSLYFSKPSNNGWFKIETSVKNGCKVYDIEGNLIATSNVGGSNWSLSTNKSTYLLAANKSGGASNRIKMKLRHFKWVQTNHNTSSSSVKVDLIPIKRNSDGEIGMLDIKNKMNLVFYPNAGTGSFTIPDISYTPSTT